jgi:hypothetical protein
MPGDCEMGKAEARVGRNMGLEQKNEGAPDVSIQCSWLVPSPRYFAQNVAYCRDDQPVQVEAVVVGVDCAAGTWKCRTPSSIEQKSRTPV